MSELFHAFWWLLFPLSWSLFAGWRAFLAYRARRDAMDLIQTYVRSGLEAPPELFAKLNRV